MDIGYGHLIIRYGWKIMVKCSDLIIRYGKISIGYGYMIIRYGQLTEWSYHRINWSNDQTWSEDLVRGSYSLKEIKIIIDLYLVFEQKINILATILDFEVRRNHFGFQNIHNYIHYAKQRIYRHQYLDKLKVI